MISTDLETFFSEWHDIQSTERRSSYHPQEEKEVERLTDEDKEDKGKDTSVLLYSLS